MIVSVWLTVISINKIQVINIILKKTCQKWQIFYNMQQKNYKQLCKIHFIILAFMKHMLIINLCNGIIQHIFKSLVLVKSLFKSTTCFYLDFKPNFQRYQIIEF